MQLCAFLCGAAWSTGGGGGWWRAHDGSRDAFLAPAEVAVAQLCQRFAPFEQHVELVSRQTGMARENARALLQQLQQRGLVVGIEAVAPARAESLPELPDPLIAIRTFRRPDSLRKVLSSALEDERRYGVRRRHVVIDDADGEADAAGSAEIVAEWRAQGLNVGYFGPEQRERALVEVGVGADSHPLRSMLTPRAGRTATGGRTWNWSILLGAGASLSFVDDDCAFPVRTPEHTYRAWSLRESLANEGRFFDAGLPELPVVAEDPFAIMKRVVGQPVAAIWHRDGVAGNHFAGMNTAQFQPWQGGKQVLAASTGIYGGHVYNSSAYFSVTDAASLRDLLRAPFRIERLDGNDVWQGVSAARMTRYAVYSPMLLDTRELMPFTTALGKGDDTAFFGLLTGIEPRAAFAYLPMLMGHFPSEDRQRRARAQSELFLDSNHYIGFFAERAAQNLLGSDRGVRLAAISALARDAERTRDVEFAAEVQLWRGRKISDLLAGLHEARNQAGAAAPPEWLEFVAAVERANREAMVTPVSAARLANYRHVLAQVGRAGDLWPLLWEQMRAGLAARLLAESGLA